MAKEILQIAILTTVYKHTVCERLDNGSSEIEIACEHNIYKSNISDIYKL